MNKRKELQWWIEFGQKDLKKIKQKTRDKLQVELTQKALSYTSLWTEPVPENKSVRYKGVDGEEVDFTLDYDLEEYREATGAVVDQLKKVLDQDTDDMRPLTLWEMMPWEVLKYTAGLHLSGGQFRSTVFCLNLKAKNFVCFYIYMLMDGTIREDYKYCPFCGNLFLQVSMEKKYCTQYCSINASRSKKE